MSGALRVRPVAPDDLTAITDIYRHAVLHGTATWEVDPPDRAEIARRFAALADAGYPRLVATRDGVVLGYAYAGSYRPRAAYRWTVEDSVYVSPAAQRMGVGRALLGALIETCEALGYRQMVAVIGDRDNAGSVALHRALGFVDVGVARSVGYKHGRWLDQVLMQRALGPGDATPPGELGRWASG
jgi:L-amino acid N-acyltransferase YncA